MAVRMIECRRVLKPTGSIYVHCDSHANSYLRMLMDAVFGADNFRSEISWKRTSAHSDTRQGRRQHGRVRDILLFYSKSEQWTWNPIYTDYDPEYVNRNYRHIEPDTVDCHSGEGLGCVVTCGRLGVLRGGSLLTPLHSLLENCAYAIFSPPTYLLTTPQLGYRIL